MDERQFFDESRTTREAVLVCPRCREKQTFQLRWLVRRKKRRLPPQADERDRAKFAKSQSYMLLLDDVVSCQNQRCRGRIEISGIKTTAFLEDSSGEAPAEANGNVAQKEGGKRGPSHRSRRSRGRNRNR